MIYICDCQREKNFTLAVTNIYVFVTGKKNQNIYIYYIYVFYIIVIVGGVHLKKRLCEVKGGGLGRTKKGSQSSNICKCICIDIHTCTYMHIYIQIYTYI